MRKRKARSFLVAASLWCWYAPHVRAAPAGAAPREAVDRTVIPLMRKYGIPGMAVGIAIGGRRYVYDYGAASATTGQKVTADTLFELGSISKTYTASLAAYAAIEGKLALEAPASRYIPSLAGSAFDRITVRDLATHTTGGLPLTTPGGVTDDEAAMAWLQGWKPAYAPGAVRTYSNLDIGLLGLAAADSLHGDFAGLMRQAIFAGLGLHHTYLTVPPAEMANYAQGMTVAGKPIRLAPGPLAAPAYGIRATAGDVLTFAAANAGLLTIGPTLRQALDATHTGYDAVPPTAMTQDLAWEQYPYPVALAQLLAGNATTMALDPHPVAPLTPPEPPRGDALIDKTGSTNGFGNYVLFVPARKLAIVLLANRNYPVAARVTAAYAILTQLVRG